MPLLILYNYLVKRPLVANLYLRLSPLLPQKLSPPWGKINPTIYTSFQTLSSGKTIHISPFHFKKKEAKQK